LKLNISASTQDIKNLVGNFEALHVGNVHAYFQASCSSGMGGGGGDERTDTGRHPIFT